MVLSEKILFALCLTTIKLLKIPLRFPRASSWFTCPLQYHNFQVTSPWSYGIYPIVSLCVELCSLVVICWLSEFQCQYQRLIRTMAKPVFHSNTAIRTAEFVTITTTHERTINSTRFKDNHICSMLTSTIDGRPRLFTMSRRRFLSRHQHLFILPPEIRLINGSTHARTSRPFLTLI